MLGRSFLSEHTRPILKDALAGEHQIGRLKTGRMLPQKGEQNSVAAVQQQWSLK